MKFKKLLGYLSVMILGAAIIASIDHLIGIKFTDDVGVAARLIHTVVYILWGAAILRVWQCFDD